MRVSLCVITGNESAIIHRMLDSFSVAFDELSLVRAVGSTPPDDTVDRARSWCESRGVAFLFSEYRNGPGAEGWPHVDDFSAARNQAFAQATGDWLVWADVDDTLTNAPTLRAVLEDSATGTLARFAYDVLGTGKRPMRERAIRRDAFHAGNRWHFAVHENLLVRPGTNITSHPAPVWVHQPKKISIDNRKRNKLILGRVLQHAAANYYYVHQEWFCEGNKYNAQKFGRIALELPDLDPSFRYETNINLARLADDPREAIAYAMAAHAVFPWCREAMAMLALTFLERKDTARALYFAQKLDATPLPPPDQLPWTHEPKWYGWAGIDLLARCQRAAGQHGAAIATQARLGQPVISLIHATRGRPHQAVQARTSWLQLAKNPESIEHIFCLDEGDENGRRLLAQFHTVTSPGSSCVAAWNRGAHEASGKLLVQLSDDWIPVPCWDALLLEEIARSGKTLDDSVVVAVSDGHRKDDLLCMAIMTRARWEAQSHEVFSQEYESVFSDNEFSHRAWRDGVVIDARERITFDHQHPAFNAAPMDATYSHNNAPERYKRGEETFRRRNPDAVLK